MTSSTSPAPDAVGALVAAFGERLALASGSPVRTATVRACVAAGNGRGPRVTVADDAGEHTLTSVTSAFAAAIGQSLVGRDVLVLSDSGQWVGVDVLNLCGGPV